jgi:hydrogenase nickel incorporation protein HypA/HybF
MHELSIVLSIVNSVQTEVAKQEAKEVRRIELDIGNMAGIEWDSFDFAWEPATKNTVLEKAERVINHIPAMATCVACEHEFEKHAPYDACPVCGNYLHHLRSGKELKIKSLVIA